MMARPFVDIEADHENRFEIVLFELVRWYEYWMGLQIHPRSWKIHKPERGEL